jgi:hypothetical protein
MKRYQLYESEEDHLEERKPYDEFHDRALALQALGTLRFLLDEEAVLWDEELGDYIWEDS